MSEDMQKRVTDDKDSWYGWWRIKPRFLQCLNSLVFFMSLAVLLNLVFGFVLGWLGISIQSIEKQLGLSSTVSATIASANDLGNTCTVIFVGYIGTKYNKARGMACGMFLLGLGMILSGLPHYLLDSYHPPVLGSNSTPGQPPICPVNDSSSSSSRPVSDSQDGSHMAYLSLLIVGQVLSGIGGTPVLTFGVSYIDDNAEVATAAILIGVANTVMAVGAAVSALAGGPLIEYLYVDFDRVDTSSLPFGRGDPQWIGAWWIGFIVSGILCIIVSIPLSGFPKLLPSSPIKKSKEATKVKAPRNIFSFLKKTIMDFLRALFKLIFDLEFLFLVLSATIEGIAVGGSAIFGFKFINHEYDMEYDVAGYVLGSKALVGSVGCILAGYLVKWFKLDLLGMEKTSLILYFTTVVFGLSLFAACPNVDMLGIERPYPGESSVLGLISECQGQCLCEGQHFSPTCGSDGLVYFSPCHAGCLNVNMEGGIKTFTNCSCVATNQNVSISDVMATATLGKCDAGCWQTYFVMPCLFIVYVLMITSGTLSTLTIIRCVDQEFKPFALGIRMIFYRVLGTIPAPLVIGRIVDSACKVWSGSESDEGRFCEMYDKKWLATGIALMWMTAGLISCVFMILACLTNIWKRKRAERRKGTNTDDVIGNSDVKDFKDVNVEKNDLNTKM